MYGFKEQTSTTDIKEYTPMTGRLGKEVYVWDQGTDAYH